MGIEVSDYIDVKEKCESLGLDASRLGLTFLPKNFDSASSRQELVYQDSLPTVRVLCRQADLDIRRLEAPDEPIPQAGEKGFVAWVAPIVLVGYAYYTQNPAVVSIALNVIAAYLADWFKGLAGEKRVELEIVVETRNGGFKRVHYQGTPEQMQKVADVVAEVFRDA